MTEPAQPSPENADAARGVMEALALRLRDAAQTAQNDDLSKPETEKRQRHIIRVEAMLDAAEHLEELAGGIRAQPTASPENETLQGYTEGYAASLRQQADLMEKASAGKVSAYVAIDDFDVDELREAADFIERIRAQCVPSVVEVASVVHDARFGPDYPENMRNSFDTECASGRAYCIRIARAVLDGFQLAHTSSSSSPDR